MSHKLTAQDELQALLHAAVSAVSPAHAHLVNSSGGRVKKSLKAGKPGGAGDYESCIAIVLYHHLQAMQRRIQSCNSTEQGVTLTSVTSSKSLKPSSAEGPVTVLSPYGIYHSYTSPSHLCDAIVGELADLASAPQSSSGAGEKPLVADVCSLPGRGKLSGSRVIVSITTGGHLARQAAAGMLRCPICDCFFHGERGLVWHNLMKHKQDYQTSQDVAEEQRLALAAWSLPDPQSDLGRMLTACRAGKPGMKACKDGDMHQLRQALGSGWSAAEATDRHGSGALLWAAGGGHLQICQFLVNECGCCPTVHQAKDGRNALHWACRNGHLSVVRWLVLEQGLSPDIPTHDGTAPIHWAAWQGHLAIIQWLVEDAKCRWEVSNRYACSAIHWASQGTSDKAPEVIGYLVHLGLDMTAQNLNGHSPLHKAAQRGHSLLIDWFLHGEGREAILSSGVLHLQDNDGNLPADCARLEGFADISETLASAALQDVPEELAVHLVDEYGTDANTVDGCQLVSVIVPVHNAEDWLDETLQAIFLQEEPAACGVAQVQVLLWDDVSTDGSLEIMKAWAPRFADREGWTCKIGGSDPTGGATGCGRAKNAAIAASSGRFLFMQDADDVSHSSRMRLQLREAMTSPPKTIVGCNFDRIPKGATWHYTAWANTLTDQQLLLQRFRECTVIAPTWFMSRETFEASGGYGSSLGDDLMLFQQHCNRGGKLRIVGGGVSGTEPLLSYRHHLGNLSGRTSRSVLLTIRSQAFVEGVLEGHDGHDVGWDRGFTIWNAGRDGRQFLASLPPTWQRTCRAFCDIDPKKIGRAVNVSVRNPTHESNWDTLSIPVISWEDAEPPLVLCVALGRTGGAFERHVADLAKRLDITEGVHYWHFS